MEAERKHNYTESPRKNANILSYLTFWWVLPVLFKGKKKELDLNDLYKPLEDHEANRIGKRLCDAWDDELKTKTEKNQSPSLYKVFWRVFGWQIMLMGLYQMLIELLFRLSQPLFLGLLITYYAKTVRGDISEAYWYSAGIIASSAFNVLFTHGYMLTNLHLGMKMRVSACSMIYRKALRLSKTSLIDTTAGQVVNLLSNDVGRLDLAILFVHYLWLGPLTTVLITYLMYREIGYASFFGVFFLLLFVPLQIFLGKKTSTLRLRTALRTDERVRMMNEIIQGIQVIKMYAWEKPFATLVSNSRKKEITVIRYVSWIRGVLLSFIMFVTRVSIFISLVAFALLGNIVTAQQAFMITAYYNILRPSMTIFLPQAIGQFAETLVSIGRLEKYMLYGEIETKEEIAKAQKRVPKSVEVIIESQENGIKLAENLESKLEPLNEENFQKTSDESPGDQEKEEKKDNPEKIEQNGIVPESIELVVKKHLSPPGIAMENVTAKWNPKSSELTLDRVNLRVQPGSVAAVIGTVGAGKSSLLQALLFELPIDSGIVYINGSISYAAQEPWLFSGSVRQNILFGEEMDKHRYREVIKNCALERDFELLPNGDKTVVGERGMSLSGGQKARINLARAVYRKSAIYLLDDPLSAVDSHVGRHLFDQCIKGFLKDKIVVLVTHQLQYLQNADQIVLLEHGKVEAVGTYESLRDSGLDFAKLLVKEEEETFEASDQPLNRSISKNSSRMKRQNSESSMTSSIEENNPQNAVEVEEKRAEGSIGMRIYKAYFKAGGGYFIVAIVLLFFLLAQLAASAGDYFLSYWVNKEAQRAVPQLANETETEFIQTLNSTLKQSSFKEEVNKFYEQVFAFFADSEYDRNIDIYIFTGLTVATVVISLWRSLMFFNIAMKASKKLHDAMFTGVTRASMYFFNTNPSGRILNRFSKDMGQIDEILPSIMIDVIQIALSLIGIVVVVSIVNFYYLIPTLIIGILFYFMRDFYLLSSRNIKRMEATTRSPIYSHLAASLNGLSTIRAFNAENILTKEFDHHQDLHSSAFYLFMSTSRAFGFYLDFCCVVYIAIVTLSFFVMDNNNGGNVGLAITQALGLTGMVQWGMRQSAELENTMTSVERVVEYDTVDPEPPLISSPDKKPPKTWPDNGLIKFNKLSLRYIPEPSSDLVLKELEFEIMPQEKIGIVGRTGAGKSSIIQALFRLSYNEGSIEIDLHDTKNIGLHDLRSKISIIPQEPVLFSGSLRYNLDPFEEYTDEKLWTALEEVKLKTIVSELPAGLMGLVSEGGTNFSVGQRQLVCLARAILRENKILVMDEATANVDPQTDALIQQTMRSKFANCTVLTIAHRLNTVMDSDKILVMDAGKCVEFGTPYELLMKSSQPKVFYDMVKQTGKGTFDVLKKIAEENYRKKKNQ